jgi:transcriptional regulator with XRE-family HTH domain
MDNPKTGSKSIKYENACYIDPELPARVNRICQNFLIIPGFSLLTLYRFQHGKTKAYDIAYFNIRLAEAGYFRRANLKRLEPATYYRMNRPTKPLTPEQGAAIFSMVLKQITDGMITPHPNTLAHRCRLARYQAGLTGSEIAPLIGYKSKTYRPEYKGECSLPTGLAICRALNLNPYWLAAGVKRMYPFRKPTVPIRASKISKSIPLHTICTPYALVHKASIEDRKFHETLAQLKGKHGKQLLSLLRLNRSQLHEWENATTTTPRTRARVYLAANNIFQGDNGFYRQDQTTVTEQDVRDALPGLNSNQYIKKVLAGEYRNNPALNEPNYKNTYKPKRQQKITDTLQPNQPTQTRSALTTNKICQ